MQLALWCAPRLCGCLGGAAAASQLVATGRLRNLDARHWARGSATCTEQPQAVHGMLLACASKQRSAWASVWHLFGPVALGHIATEEAGNAM